MLKSTGMLSQRDVVLVLSQPEHLRELREQLANLEHNLHVAIGFEGLRHYLNRFPDDLVLVDAELFLAPSLEDPVALLKEMLHHKPCAVLSEDGSFALRHASVLIGAHSFLTLPIDPSVLSERLDALSIEAQEQPPPKIFSLQYGAEEGVSTILEQIPEAEISISHFRSPRQMFDALVTRRPELFLLDSSGGYEPEILDVVRAIRQDANLLGIPVLLSTEQGSMQGFLDAMHAGCDNIIERPARTEHLLAAIRPRVKRFRKLRASMAIDGLTGLYNHTHFKERLQAQVSQSARTRSPISLAMLDIDSFKQINDTYGHPAGDSVLRHLAQLLKGRLRRSDILGRYGGDEFAILMLDTEIHDAGHVMEQVRRRFNEIEHPGQRGVFRTSFSCGIASFPTYDTETSLTMAADQALYEAKRQGKNRIYARA